MIWHSWPLALRHEHLRKVSALIEELNEKGGYRKPKGRASDVAETISRHLSLADSRTQDFVTFPMRSGFDALLSVFDVLQADTETSIVLPDFAYHATGLAATRTRAETVWCDIDPTDWNPSADAIRDALSRTTKRKRILLVVDNFGLPANLAAIRLVADEYEAALVLDACESLGSTRNDWSLADATVMSFSFSKPVHGAGMGGAMVLRGDLADKMTTCQMAGATQVRLPEFNAAYLLEAWNYLDAALTRLRTIYDRYSTALTPLGWNCQEELHGRGSRLHAPFLVPRSSPVDRDGLLLNLRAAGIEARLQFPLQRRYLGLPSAERLETSAEVESRVIALPTGAGMPFEIVDAVLSTVFGIVRT